MNKDKTNHNGHPPDRKTSDIPNDVIESLARCALPLIQAYFESEEGQRAFAEWKAKKRKEEPCR